MAPSLMYSSGHAYYNFHNHHSLHPVSLHNNQSTTGHSRHPPSYVIDCAFTGSRYYPNSQIMTTPPNPNEMEDFQRLSDNYQADLPGPLIGEKLPMSVLVTEYAQADPTYVVKTAALASKYSAYRTVKGDGQCGWRGAVFGYFETLLQVGDLDIVQQERVRLQTFEDTMKMAGIDYDILTEMFEFTWDLFDNVEKAVERQDKSESVILDVLNDSVQSDSIVYHFKMMTSAFMQLHADDYEPFLEISIGEYRVSRIDPTNQEIDQIGLQALTRAVIEPANIALEVLYLDRSTGEEVTPHQFTENPAGKPTIRLLYRPGHYDMIYKGEPAVQIFLQRESLMPQPTQISQPSSLPPDLQAWLFTGSEAMHTAQGHSSSYYNVDHGANNHNRVQYSYCSHPQPPTVMPTTTFDVSTAQAAIPMLNTDFNPPYPVQAYHSPCPSDISSSPNLTTPTLSSRCPPLPAPPLSTAMMPKKSTSGPQIRLNANCFNYRLRHESVPLCTQSYGSAAALSPAHFRNHDFQPLMWDAEQEYAKS